MAYPSAPNFAVVEQDSAWWKVRNPSPGVQSQYVCSTNGPGFIAQLKSVLRAVAQGVSADRWVRPDGSATNSLSELGDSARWNETTLSLLAAWLRLVSGGSFIGMSGATPPAPDVTGGMAPWARALQSGIAADLAAQRVGIATLRVAVWCLAQARDRSTGGRLGDPARAGTEGSSAAQLTMYDDILVQDNAVSPPWDRDIAGTPQATVCHQVSMEGEIRSVPTYTGPVQMAPRGLFDFSGLSNMDWLKLGGIGVIGGLVGHELFMSQKGKKRRRATT